VKSIIVAMPSAGENVPVYNIHVKLDVTHGKKRGECAIGIAHAIQFPELMIHIILKGVQETETKAVNLLNHSKV
jgi:hypothetical protein